MGKETTTASQLDYIHKMIGYAIANNRQDVISLLTKNGVNVAPTVSDTMLRQYVDSALANSESFKASFLSLLKTIASGKKKAHSFAEQTPLFNEPFFNKNCVTTADMAGVEKYMHVCGTGTTPPPACCCCSWFSQVFNPKTTDTLLTSALGLYVGTKKAGTTPAIGTPGYVPPSPTKSTSIVVPVIITIVILGVVTFAIIKIRQKSAASAAS